MSEDAQNWSEAWARAEAKVAAIEEVKESAVAEKLTPKKPALKSKADKVAEKKPAPKAAKKEAAPEPEEELEEAEQPEAPKAAPKKEESKAAKPPAKAEAPEEDSEEEEESDSEASKKPAKAKAEAAETDEDDDPSALSDKLQRLAKKLGLKVEAGAVTTEERVGFRAEKRRFKEKHEAEVVELQRKIQAAEKYFAPSLKAQQAVDSGDYDAALIALGLKGGLAEANDKYIERQSGKDPRVTQLEKQLDAERKARVEREEHEAQSRAQFEQERAERQAVSEISSELTGHPQLGILGSNEWFAKGVLKVQQDHWDGYETLSVEAAAYENIQLLRNDPRAKMAYEALRLAFGGHRSTREAEIPERRAAMPPVRRSDETSVRPDDDEPSTTLPKRKAAEASAPQQFTSDTDWVRWGTALLRQSVPE